MTITGIKIKRTAIDEDPAAWAQAFGESSSMASAIVLKDEPGSSWVRRTDMLGKDVVVKGRLLKSFSRRVKSLLGLSHAAKQWRGAELLKAIGTETSRPLAHAEARIDGVLVELLILEYLDGPTLLDVLNAASRGDGPPVRVQHAVARAVGLGVQKLLSGRVWNHDHKPSNLIVRGLFSEEPRIGIIDCVGLRTIAEGRPDTGHAQEMCASLMTEPIGCGCPPRAALWMRAVRSMGSVEDLTRFDRHAVLRDFLQEISANLPSAALAKPKINPLATPVR